jgi:hypothetical protein
VSVRQAFRILQANTVSPIAAINAAKDHETNSILQLEECDEFTLVVKLSPFFDSVFASVFVLVNSNHGELGRPSMIRAVRVVDEPMRSEFTKKAATKQMAAAMNRPPLIVLRISSTLLTHAVLQRHLLPIPNK